MVKKLASAPLEDWAEQPEKQQTESYFDQKIVHYEVAIYPL